MTDNQRLLSMGLFLPPTSKPASAKAKLRRGLAITALLLPLQSWAGGAINNPEDLIVDYDDPAPDTSEPTPSSPGISAEEANELSYGRFDASWFSLGLGATHGQHSGPWILLASTYLLENRRYGTTRLVWSMDLSKATEVNGGFTYLEVGQLFGKRLNIKGDEMSWAVGLAWVSGDDRSDDTLDFSSLGIAWEIEAKLSQFYIFGGSVKLSGNLNQKHSLIGFSFNFNLGDFI